MLEGDDWKGNLWRELLKLFSMVPTTSTGTQVNQLSTHSETYSSRHLSIYLNNIKVTGSPLKAAWREEGWAPFGLRSTERKLLWWEHRWQSRGLPVRGKRCLWITAAPGAAGQCSTTHEGHPSSAAPQCSPPGDTLPTPGRWGKGDRPCLRLPAFPSPPCLCLYSCSTAVKQQVDPWVLVGTAVVQIYDKYRSARQQLPDSSPH